MVDNKNIDDNLDDEKDLDSLGDDLEEQADLDFSVELSNLESKIREVAWDKIKKKEQEIIAEASDELSSLGAEIGSGWLSEGFNENSKDKVSEFFWKWKEEFKVIDTRRERKVVRKHKIMKSKFELRPDWVKQAIEQSVDRILDEIYNWKEEKNPVARSLLRIVNRILKTEKKLGE